MLKSANLLDIYLKIQYGLSVIFDKIRALGLYCLVIGKACARYDQVGKSRKKLIKAIHDLWKKNKQTKKPLDDFWQS